MKKFYKIASLRSAGGYFFYSIIIIGVLSSFLMMHQPASPTKGNEYPFLHIDKTPDVLGPFFKQGSVKPNIVFIIMESMGRAYSGPDASQGDFTPFLDSLMPYSLYWEHFLSGAGRTFGVIPNIFGSCPYAENGFLDLGDKMPVRNSMIHILKQNRYYASYYYGGEAHFENMDMFFKQDSTDRIIDTKDFGPEYKKMPANGDGFTWGYSDRDVFKKVLETEKEPINKPRLDVIMTLSNHTPYLVENQKQYINKATAMLSRMPGFTAKKKADYQQYLKIFSCILYTDDAIRYFINEYKKRPDFKNTIFIITGDHRTPDVPIITKIDRFHVPFMIYSPLIKYPRRFKSISTDVDITPSILAFMGRNYGVKLPKYTSWVGTGIDTARNFRNIHSVAMMPYKGSLTEYMDGLSFLSGEQIFKIYPSMDIEPADDETAKATLKMMLNTYKAKNKTACFTNKLYPDSMLKMR